MSTKITPKMAFLLSHLTHQMSSKALAKKMGTVHTKIGSALNDGKHQGLLDIISVGPGRFEWDRTELGEKLLNEYDEPIKFRFRQYGKPNAEKLKNNLVWQFVFGSRI